MRIAVLMSTYNGERFLREQINSILSQEGDYQLDLWVRDDGSSDSTKSILDAYQKEGQLRWYSGKNLKPAHSFIDLVKKAKGYDFYAFADQDDWWEHDKIKRGIEKIKCIRYPALYCANAELVDEKLNTLGRVVYKKAPKTDFYTLSCAGGLLGCTMVFNAMLATLIQNKEMPGKMVLHDFYVSLLCLSVGGKIIYDERACMKYRQHGGNVVGVSYGLMRTFKSRLKSIINKSVVSISNQAETITQLYSSEIPVKSLEWLKRISQYKKSFFFKVALAVSHRTKYMNRNMGLKLRLSILLGNR